MGIMVLIFNMFKIKCQKKEKIIREIIVSNVKRIKEIRRERIFCVKRISEAMRSRIERVKVSMHRRYGLMREIIAEHIRRNGEYYYSFVRCYFFKSNTNRFVVYCNSLCLIVLLNSTTRMIVFCPNSKKK